MATIKDIAKKMNLGVSTVSMALNDNPKISIDTRNKVLAVARDLGYVKNGFAADLQKGRSNLILLVVDDASRPFFARIINAVQKQVARYNFDLLICTTFENHTITAKKYISEHRAAGAIVYTMNIEDEFLKTYASEDFPVFVLGRYVADENVKSVVKPENPEPLGLLATQYLIDKGFRRIAFVKAALNTLGTVRRFEGYLKGLAKNNIPFDEDIVFAAEDSSYESGYSVTTSMIEKLEPLKIDAIFYANDDIAIGGLRSLLDHGINVPKDISIIGHNDLPHSKLLIPALTSVYGDQTIEPTYAVDYIVAKILNKETESIDKKYLEKIKNNPEKIVERETVKK